MARTTVKIDGKPVASGVVAAYAKLKAAFEKAFPGLKLVITYGIRTEAEQTRIFLERYVRKSDVRGRHVYDTMSWNGAVWYRISPAGRVAPPGQSLHETGRALDIRDTGSDPGVTAYGNKRSKWIKKNVSKYGFKPAGYDLFNEPWHIEYQGDPWAGGTPASTTPKSKPTTTKPVTSEEDDMGGFAYMTDVNKPYYWFSFGRGKSRKLSGEEVVQMRSAQRSGIPGNEIHKVGPGWYANQLKLGTYEV